MKRVWTARSLAAVLGGSLLYFLITVLVTMCGSFSPLFWVFLPAITAAASGWLYLYLAARTPRFGVPVLMNLGGLLLFLAAGELSGWMAVTLATGAVLAELVRRLGGQVVEIAPGSPNHINPMDIQLDLDDDESPLSMKADFLLSLCELVVGGKDGLQPIEKTVIDRCVRLIYRDMALGIGDGKPPLLQDLYEELLKQPEPEARRVATALELYCTGSLNLFNHQTNVKLTSHIVCIVLKGLGENLRKIAMHVTNDFVTSAVNVNFHSGVSTWCYFDEFHILLRDPLTASYFVTVWKMLRKQGCVPSALTQNVKDLLASREIENILDNTDFMILLSQAQSDRAILAKQIGISEHQLSYITQSNSGEGLLFYGSVTIPFVDRFPRGEIYDLLTTKPEDAANGKQTE